MRALLSQTFLVTTLCGLLFADIKSTTGNILFDPNSDDNTDWTLNDNGLGNTASPSSNLHVSGNTTLSGNTYIGTTSGKSSLELHGTIGYGIESISGNTTLSGNSVVLVDTSAGNLNLLLPSVSDVQGRKYTVKKISNSNTLFINSLIDGLSTITLKGTNNVMPYLTLYAGTSTYHITSMSGNGDLVSSDNLVAWWPLEESTGTNADDMGSNGYDGTLVNLSFSSNSVAGVMGNALDGLDNAINMGNQPNLEVGTGDYTLSAWVKPEVISGLQTVFFNGCATAGAGQPGFWTYISATGQLVFRFSDGSATYLTATTTAGDVVASQWQHIVVTFDRDGNMEAFVDNDSKGSVDISAQQADSDSTRNFVIGASSTGSFGNYLDGSVDDIRVYNKLLSADEISRLYNTRH